MLQVKARIASALLLAALATSVAHADVISRPLTRALADSLYCRLTVCVSTTAADARYLQLTGAAPMTGMLTLIQGTQTDEAIFFTPSGMSIYSGSTFVGIGDSTNTWMALGGGVALRSGGTVTWSSSATDALAAADLRVLRASAGALSVDGGSGVDGSISSAVLIPGAGTAAAPSIQIDGGTGIFRSAADVIGFSTDAVERWVINASGALNCATDGGCDIGNGAADPRDLSLRRSLILRGATSGSLTQNAPAVAAASVITWPAGTTDFSATGGSGFVLKQDSAGAALTVAQLAAANLSNGVTGTGAVMLAASPATTGVLGAEAITASSTITPSSTAGIVGTIAADNAQAGSVGEFASASVVFGSAVSLVSATAANITSVSLTAGDWDCQVTATFAPAAATSFTVLLAATNTTSATAPTDPGTLTQIALPATVNGGLFYTVVSPTRRFSLASTTTVYGVARATFTVDTMTVHGLLRCRRVR